MPRSSAGASSRASHARRAAARREVAATVRHSRSCAGSTGSRTHASARTSSVACECQGAARDERAASSIVVLALALARLEGAHELNVLGELAQVGAPGLARHRGAVTAAPAHARVRIEAFLGAKPPAAFLEDLQH